MANLHRPPRVAWFVIAALLALLSGCKEPLYTQLTEQEANEVFAVLARSGIEASKAAVGDKSWGIEVFASDIPAAVDALNAAGLPRSRFANLGDMFRREGIVATPTEERVRFMHGVSQELSNTLSGIDGVIGARVHLVIPQNDPLAEKNKVASASVFIKHRIDVDLQPMLPAIKSLVLRSVEGLTFDTVFVSFFPSERPAASSAQPIQVPLFGLQLPRYLATWLNPLLGLIFLGSLALAVYTLMRHRVALREDLGRLFGTSPPKAIERAVQANVPLAPATPGDSDLR
jgi:type III secretion protein J